MPGEHRALRRLSRLKACEFRPQQLDGLRSVRILRYATDGAKYLALRLIEMANTFGTTVRIDLIDFLAHRNRLVWAGGFANITVDTLIGNLQRHGDLGRGLG